MLDGDRIIPYVIIGTHGLEITLDARNSTPVTAEFRWEPSQEFSRCSWSGRNHYEQ